MSNDLVEKVAKAFKHELGEHFLSHSSYRDLARAALAAIDASGGHVVAPRVPDRTMKEMGGGTLLAPNAVTAPPEAVAEALYRIMLSARSPITGDTQ